MSLDRLRASLADRYRIERELGAGGMATVYLAQDLRHDRKVAVKVLRPELAAVIGAERFLAEIKTTARLQYPHILPLGRRGRAALLRNAAGHRGDVARPSRALVAKGIEARDSYLAFLPCPAWGPFRADAAGSAMLEGLGVGP